VIWSYRRLPEVNRWLGGSNDEEAFRQRFLHPDESLRQLVVLHEGTAGR
jgi:hypothetical protein